MIAYSILFCALLPASDASALLPGAVFIPFLLFGHTVLLRFDTMCYNDALDNGFMARIIQNDLFHHLKRCATE